MRMWGGRFASATDPLAADATRSIEVDHVLAADDLQGSIAHVHGLARAGLIDAGEEAALIGGLEALAVEVEADTFAWDPTLEDVHLNLEAALESRLGSVAGKLHTGRSRNDQVALDLRLWLRRTIAALDVGFVGLERALLGRAEADADAIMPGMTHTQPAQPVLLAHHLLAHVEMLERDRGRFRDAWSRADRSPLGAGAIAGAGFPIDREGAAAELGFAGVTTNSIDAVGDRDFLVEALAAAALAMVHLSRLAEELVWWSSPVVGWVVMDDAWSTGSSMMPNKKNPDPSELIRGRASRVAGELAGVLGVLKGLPLGYQRDLQETVAPFLDALAVLASSLLVMAGVVSTLRFRPERMHAAALEGFVGATSVADTLVEHDVPFRSAHGLVGRLVTEAETRGLRLDELPDGVFATILGNEVPKPVSGDELRAAATLEAALARLRVTGGSAPERVREALFAARARLDVEG